ncbi:MAG: deoxyribose-phosphate aldolase [Ferruginibacter sp.]|nr:deoxyribose-phosphate aldolase [Cytophagales bacterium]
MSSISSSLERTILHPTASVASVENAMAEARQYQLAGLCVPPFWVKKVKRDLGDYAGSLATVVGFPFGYQRTESKITEIEMALQDGATDVEVAMNTSALFSSSASWIKVEFARCATLVHARQATFTVIMEGSVLEEDQLRTYCKVSADAGADFVKNASGFVTAPLLISNLLDQIALFRRFLPASVAIKAVGKIHSPEEVKRLLQAGAERVCVNGSVKRVFNDWQPFA